MILHGVPLGIILAKARQGRTCRSSVSPIPSSLILGGIDYILIRWEVQSLTVFVQVRQDKAMNQRDVDSFKLGSI